MRAGFTLSLQRTIAPQNHSAEIECKRWSDKTPDNQMILKYCSTQRINSERCWRPIGMRVGRESPTCLLRTLWLFFFPFSVPSASYYSSQKYFTQKKTRDSSWLEGECDPPSLHSRTLMSLSLLTNRCAISNSSHRYFYHHVVHFVSNSNQLIICRHRRTKGDLGFQEHPVRVWSS